MASLSKIIELRELLTAKYPPTCPKTGGCAPTGISRIDAVLHGGLPIGGMTEIVCPVGGGLFLTALARSTLGRCGLLALIDGSDAFDPTGVPKAALRRLLWVRCHTVAQAVQAADLVLRDGNLGLVVLDLRSCRPEEVRKISSTSWYRLQRVVEPTSTAFVVLTAQPLVSAARPRLRLEARLGLGSFDRRQDDLLDQLHVELVRGQEERARQFA